MALDTSWLESRDINPIWDFGVLLEPGGNITVDNSTHVNSIFWKIGQRVTTFLYESSQSKGTGIRSAACILLDILSHDTLGSKSTPQDRLRDSSVRS